LTEKQKLRINTSEYCEKHFWAVESFLIKINWDFLFKNISWPTLCYWSFSTLCKSLFCVSIRKSFLNHSWSLSVSRYAL